MITFKQFISEDNQVIELEANAIRKDAETAGHKLYDGPAHGASGLIFNSDIEIMTLRAYGDLYDTFDYVFKPKPIDVADTKVKTSHAVNGVIYVAGADGIKILTLPGTKVQVHGELKAPSKKADLDTKTWKVIDTHGYDYTTSGLPTDPDEALRMVKDPNNRKYIRNAAKVVEV